MNLLLLTLFLITAALSVRWFMGAVVRHRAAQLMDSSVQWTATEAPRNEERGWLGNWLARAGYRSPSATLVFIGASMGGLALGLLIVLIFDKLGLVDLMVQTLVQIPGGVGDFFAAIAKAGPYFLMAVIAGAPTLVVRAARREREAAIEQDLAPTLELLATLAEAGLGLDAAIARVQESETSDRPLIHEFGIYQRDVLGGIPRLAALRQLADRIGVSSVSIFVSALIQAEQVGASLSETLRTQADDLRDRRKMRALMLAQALPVKLVFPLVVCFLPGIFYATLGPVISQLVEVVDSVLNRR